MSAHQPSSDRRLGRRSALGLIGSVPLAAGAVLAAPGIVEAGGDPAPRGGVPQGLRPGGAYDRFLEKLAVEDEFSGTVLVAHRGRHVLARSYGMADKERSIPNRTDTIYCLASAAKPFTGLSIVQLAQQGRLRFYEKVGTYVTGLPDEIANQVTVHQLLTHTSGVAFPPSMDEKRIFNSVAERLEYDKEVMRRLELDYVPGTGKAYSSAGFALLGHVVSAVSNQLFHEYVQEHIFAPAGMTSSAYYTRPDWLTNERIAHPYIYQTDGSRVDGVRNLDAGATINGGFGSNAARAFIGSGGGGGFASAPDLVRFALALQNGKLLNGPFTHLYINGKVSGAPLGGRPAPAGPEVFSAYGVIAAIHGDQRVIGHGGGIAGGNTNWSIYLDTDWVGVILANYDLHDIESIIQQERRAIAGSPS